MKFPSYGLEEGPEWRRSLTDTDPGDGYFGENIEAAREVLTIRPFGPGTEGLTADDDDVRVLKTKDELAGYRLFVGYRVDRKRSVCVLGWVELEAL